MGCDIHLYVEVKRKGKWESADEWKDVPIDEREDGKTKEVDYDKRFYHARNYNLFSILANVRNGHGFAGVKTGEGFVPICEPKGLPADVTKLVKADSDSWNGDGHSHSWLTVAELMAYDWTQSTKLSGWLNAAEFYEWTNFGSRERGESPEGWCGGVSGSHVRHVSETEMKKLIKGVQDRCPSGYHQVLETINKELASTYVHCEWKQFYYQCCSQFLGQTLPRLWRLGAFEDVRIVFWFDN